MAMWLKKKTFAKKEEKVELPEGLWVKCEICGEIIYRKEFEKNIWTCPKCNFHFRISYRNYIDLILDPDSFVERDDRLEARDVLEFPKYKEKLRVSQQRTSIKEAVVYGEGAIVGRPVVFAVMEFGFIGGSMGSVVGEKIARAIRLAYRKEVPLIIVSTSGGARMQEGILSLMQMAKTAAELALLSKKKILYVSVLTNPTYAGVMASYASLGDLIIAEPGALLGFTGPRVIEQTIGEKLPEGFQRSEFFLKHGLVDMVVSRKDLRDTLSKILNLVAYHKNRKK
jgi:acetyl-CoA carboxylase carboxyl transferase subunit beta